MWIAVIVVQTGHHYIAQHSRDMVKSSCLSWNTNPTWSSGTWEAGKNWTLTLYMLIFQRDQKHIFTFYVIHPYWHDTGSWNLPSNKARTYLFCSIVQSQNHGCWYPGNAKSQGVSNHDIYCVEPNLFGPHTLRVNSLAPTPSGRYGNNLRSRILKSVW